MKKTCNAITSKGENCRLPAGHQTTHEGKGRCKYHDQKDHDIKLVTDNMKEAYPVSPSGIRIRQLRKPDRVGVPSILFVPGYLTDKKADDELEYWTKPLTAFCSFRKFGLYYLYWKSGNKVEKMTNVIPKVLGQIGQAFMCPQEAPIKILKGIAGSIYEALKGSKEYFEQKKKLADKISSNPLPWLTFCHGPVYLVGHSLGGRLILRAASKIKKKGYLAGLVALAPAIEKKELNLSAVSRAVQHLAIIYYSKNDTILHTFYPGKAIGYEGLDRSWDKVRSHDISIFNKKKIDHKDYPQIVTSLLNKAIPITTHNYKAKKNLVEERIIRNNSV